MKREIVITKKRTNLSALEYWDLMGKEKVREVCEIADVTYASFKHMAHLRRRPSVKLAKRLVEASDGMMGFARLLDIEVRK